MWKKFKLWLFSLFFNYGFLPRMLWWRFLWIFIFLFDWMPWHVIPSWSSTEYFYAIKLVPVKKLCPSSRPQQLKLFHHSNSAAIVYDSWTNGNISNFQNCTFTVDSNLYLKRGQLYFKRGLFASIKMLNFRRDKSGKCIDYVQFTFNNKSRTRKICDPVMAANAQILSWLHFTDVSGILNVSIYVNKTAPLQQRSIEVKLVFTAYERRFYCAIIVFLQIEIN